MPREDDETTSSVLIAVRVRPPNARERGESGSPTPEEDQYILRMKQEDRGSRTFIRLENGTDREFNYDFSFQSSSDDPRMSSKLGPFANQDVVYDALGKGVLGAALAGDNVCLFAYGQTGAGKSYSMLGDVKRDPGIIPRVCQALFDEKKRLESDPETKYECFLKLSIIEIYMEQIHDLLRDRSEWNDPKVKEGLKPRFVPHPNPKIGGGYYVVHAEEVECLDFGTIEMNIATADHNRSISSHKLNSTSSRAHTLYRITYERRRWGTNPKTGKQEVMDTLKPTINLVDLAGSERSSVAGTSGKMLQEGNAINQSLLALGNCINAMASGKMKPNFRDSMLTQLLQQSMTNGKVIMIAALSPAAICRQETLSTLHFCDRMKEVKVSSKKAITRNPVDAIREEMEQMRKQMQDEIDRLKHDGGGADMSEELEQLRLDEEQRKRDYEQQLADLEKSSEQRAAEAKAQAAEMQRKWRETLGESAFLTKEDVTSPMFVNLHEDARLSETLVYPISKPMVLVGRKDKVSKPDMAFTGVGVNRRHCEILTADDGTVTLRNLGSSRTLVNGKVVPAGAQVTLKHDARIWIGTNCALKFLYPGHEADAAEKPDGVTEVDFAFAESEAAQTLSALGADALGIGASAQVSEALRAVEQGNQMARDLKKDCVFEARLVKNRFTNETEVVVKVRFASGGAIHWTADRFEQKMVELTDVWEAWRDRGGSPDDVPKDAVLDDAEPQLIGEADVPKLSLAHMIESDAPAPIVSMSGEHEGSVRVAMLPVDSRGSTGPWDTDSTEEFDPFVDNPNDLVGQTVTVEVRVLGVTWDEVGGRQAVTSQYKDVYCRYRFDPEDAECQWVQTELHRGNSNPLRFEHRQRFTLDVTDEVFERLTNSRMLVEVWGVLDRDAARRNAGNLEKLKEEKQRELTDLEADIDDKRKEVARLRALLAGASKS
eukprot:TRINITY_DN45199_c0_g1_i1.p1 TRINITY_DN45199_c0_g1~~TRINITY_DN45199_c0_g1_i1.p1  ORF type:complete len:942 (-),score=229.92 TRINITY_DN45199_c0_g1_i1:339-3164(-)